MFGSAGCCSSSHFNLGTIEESSSMIAPTFRSWMNTMAGGAQVLYVNAYFSFFCIFDKL